MSSIQANSLRQGRKVKSQLVSDQSLSKVVALGGRYRLFFRSFQDEDGIVDIAAAMAPGRSCTYEVCGTSFIPFREGMYKTDEFGKVEDTTELVSWARIARVLHEAKCANLKKQKEEEARSTAESLGKSIDTLALAKAIEGIQLDYMGGEAANGDKILPKISPFISGVQQKFTTQVLVVPISATGAPDYKNAQYASLDISNAKLKMLSAILDDDNYNNKGSEYIEVGFNYIGATKQEAGKDAKFDGITKDLSLASTYPAEWNAKGRELVNSICKGETLEETAVLMASRNGNLRSSKTVSEVASAIRKWCSNNAAIFTTIDFEADNTKYAAKDFVNTGIVSEYATVLNKLERLVNTDEEPKEEEVTEDLNKAAALANDNISSIGQAMTNDNVQLSDVVMDDL